MGNSNERLETYSRKYFQLIKQPRLDREAKQQVRLHISLMNPIPNQTYQVYLILHSNANKRIKEGQTSSVKYVPVNDTTHSQQVLMFHEYFIMEYYFEKEQKIDFEVHYGSGNTEVVELTLGKIIGARAQMCTQQLRNGETFKVVGSTVQETDCDIEFAVYAKCNKELCYRIKSLGKDNIVTNFDVYKSEVRNVMNGEHFDKVLIPYKYIGSDNEYSKNYISIEVFEYKDQHGRLIGHLKGSVEMFLNTNFIALNTTQYNEFKVTCKRSFSFVDYLRGGMQIGLVFAIDFTSSNGDINDPNSLHYISDENFNDYEIAIRECGDIVAYYDHDQMFPVYGYGAKLDENGPVNHCFPLTFTNDPNVEFIEGVMSVYREALSRVIFHGPTCFAPILKKINNEVKSAVRKGKHNEYIIIMFLTDGQINDMADTIDELVEASFLPISVIIIGIGDNDFSSMVELDADNEPLYDRNKRKAVRDLVQFVQYNKFRNNEKKLAEEVLEEVPRQVIEYYQMKNIPPGKPIVNIN